MERSTPPPPPPESLRLLNALAAVLWQEASAKPAADFPQQPKARRDRYVARAFRTLAAVRAAERTVEQAALRERQ